MDADSSASLAFLGGIIGLAGIIALLLSLVFSILRRRVGSVRSNKVFSVCALVFLICIVFFNRELGFILPIILYGIIVAGLQLLTMFIFSQRFSIGVKESDIFRFVLRIWIIGAAIIAFLFVEWVLF